jgi:hypothetical protein
VCRFVQAALGTALLDMGMFDFSLSDVYALGFQVLSC